MSGSNDRPGWMDGLKGLAEREGLSLFMQEPMSAHTSFGIGGDVAALALPEDLASLVSLLKFLRSEGVFHFILGRGTNLLAGDEGISGVALKLERGFGRIERTGEGRLVAGAGVRLSSLLNYSIAEGLSGLEFIAGIPGSVGGAALFNAGAWGSGFMERVASLTVLTPELDVEERPTEEIRFSYRETELGAGEVILAATVELAPDDPDSVRKEVQERFLEKKKGQPLSSRSAGCVFKNPAHEVSAGRLLDLMGFKGAKSGGAVVSPKHANFIINSGGAGSEDVIGLMARMRDAARVGFGVELMPEIRLVAGEFMGSPV